MQMAAAAFACRMTGCFTRGLVPASALLSDGAMPGPSIPSGLGEF